SPPTRAYATTRARKTSCERCRPRHPHRDNRVVPRPIWTGAISFGLVNVPVKLFTAVDRKAVRFNQLNSKTGSRIAQKRGDPTTRGEVAYEDIRQGHTA